MRNLRVRKLLLCLRIWKQAMLTPLLANQICCTHSLLHLFSRKQLLLQRSGQQACAIFVTIALCSIRWCIAVAVQLPC